MENQTKPLGKGLEDLEKKVEELENALKQTVVYINTNLHMRVSRLEGQTLNIKNNDDK